MENKSKVKIPIKFICVLVLGLFILVLYLIPKADYSFTSSKPTRQYEPIDNPNDFDTNCYVDEIYMSPADSNHVFYASRLLYEKVGVQFYHVTLDFDSLGYSSKNDINSCIQDYVKSINNSEYSVIYITPDSIINGEPYNVGTFMYGSKVKDIFDDNIVLYFEELFKDKYCDKYEEELYDCFYIFCNNVLNYDTIRVQTISVTIMRILGTVLTVSLIFTYLAYKKKTEETIQVLQTPISELKKKEVKERFVFSKIPNVVLVLVAVIEIFGIFIVGMQFRDYNEHTIENYIVQDSDSSYSIIHKYEPIDNPNVFNFECFYANINGDDKFIRDDDFNKAAKLLYDKTGIQLYAIRMSIPDEKYETELDVDSYINEFIEENISNPEYAIIYVYNNGKFLDDVKLKDTYWDNDLGGYFNTKPIGYRENIIIGDKASEFMDSEALMYLTYQYNSKDLDKYGYNRSLMLYESIYDTCNATLNYDDSDLNILSMNLLVSIIVVLVLGTVLLIFYKQYISDTKKVLRAVKSNSSLK